MSTNRPADAWTSGDAYEQYVGRWSRPVARQFLSWLSLPDSLRWLDVGCGTGALSGTVLEMCTPSALLGIDPSEGFVATARARLGSPARFEVGNALELPPNCGAQW